MTAWVQRLDGVVLDKRELFSFLGLQTMRRKRISWFTSDVKELFEFHISFYSRSAYATLYLSRVKFPEPPQRGTMTDQARIEAFADHGLTCSLVKIPCEKEMLSNLAIAILGLDPFRVLR